MQEQAHLFNPDDYSDNVTVENEAAKVPPEQGSNGILHETFGMEGTRAYIAKRRDTQRVLIAQTIQRFGGNPVFPTQRFH